MNFLANTVMPIQYNDAFHSMDLQSKKNHGTQGYVTHAGFTLYYSYRQLFQFHTYQIFADKRWLVELTICTRFCFDHVQTGL
jgi:hypothetical protein